VTHPHLHAAFHIVTEWWHTLLVYWNRWNEEL
jgi:hypothetical protein